MLSKCLRLVATAAMVFIALPAAAVTLSILGTPSYSLSASTLSYSSQVQNTSSSPSASLRMEMWAFPSPYVGQPITGYKLADTGPLSSLSAGFIRTWAASGSYLSPPFGTWTVTLLWTEQDNAGENDGYRPRAWVNFASRTFGIQTVTAPAVPTGLIATVMSSTEAQLRWNISRTPSGVAATTYNIYSNGNLIGAANGPASSILNLTAGATYRFTVAACDAQQRCSAQSAGSTITTLAAGSASVANFTSLWWNPNESGWGLNVTHQGNIAFATLFTYDAQGQPMWLVMSNGARQGSSTVFVGDLYLARGPAFNAQPFTPITAANLTRVGTMTLDFNQFYTGTLTYSVNGVQVSKIIVKQLFGSRTAQCLPTSGNRAIYSNYQDLWWNPSESGWGLNLTHQDDTIFATLFTYNFDGSGLWLVMSNGARQVDGSYLGTLYRTRGPAFNAVPFTPINSSNLTAVGSMRLIFTDGSTATLIYSVNGVTVVKTITRQVFASPLPGCTS